MVKIVQDYLNGKEYECYKNDISRVITDLIGKMIFIADKHNVDRDDVMQHFSQLLSVMVQIGTFEHFRKGDEQMAEEKTFSPLYNKEFYEFGYMAYFAENEDLTSKVVLEQLRCLWTSYCLHHDKAVNTLEYDDDFLTLWISIKDNECLGLNSNSEMPEEFYNFMCKFLV